MEQKRKLQKGIKPESQELISNQEAEKLIKNGTVRKMQLVGMSNTTAQVLQIGEEKNKKVKLLSTNSGQIVYSKKVFPTNLTDCQKDIFGTIVVPIRRNLDNGGIIIPNQILTYTEVNKYVESQRKVNLKQGNGQSKYGHVKTRADMGKDKPVPLREKKIINVFKKTTKNATTKEVADKQDVEEVAENQNVEQVNDYSNHLVRVSMLNGPRTNTEYTTKKQKDIDVYQPSSKSTISRNKSLLSNAISFDVKDQYICLKNDVNKKLLMHNYLSNDKINLLYENNILVEDDTTNIVGQVIFVIPDPKKNRNVDGGSVIINDDSIVVEDSTLKDSIIASSVINDSDIDMVTTCKSNLMKSNARNSIILGSYLSHANTADSRINMAIISDASVYEGAIISTGVKLLGQNTEVSGNVAVLGHIVINDEKKHYFSNSKRIVAIGEKEYEEIRNLDDDTLREIMQSNLIDDEDFDIYTCQNNFENLRQVRSIGLNPLLEEDTLDNDNTVDNGNTIDNENTTDNTNTIDNENTIDNKNTIDNTNTFSNEQFQHQKYNPTDIDNFCNFVEMYDNKFNFVQNLLLNRLPAKNEELELLNYRQSLWQLAFDQQDILNNTLLYTGLQNDQNMNQPLQLDYESTSRSELRFLGELFQKAVKDLYQTVLKYREDLSNSEPLIEYPEEENQTIDQNEGPIIVEIVDNQEEKENFEEELEQEETEQKEPQPEQPEKLEQEETEQQSQPEELEPKPELEEVKQEPEQEEPQTEEELEQEETEQQETEEEVKPEEELEKQPELVEQLKIEEEVKQQLQAERQEPEQELKQQEPEQEEQNLKSKILEILEEQNDSTSTEELELDKELIKIQGEQEILEEEQQEMLIQEVASQQIALQQMRLEQIQEENKVKQDAVNNGCYYFCVEDNCLNIIQKESICDKYENYENNFNFDYNGVVSSLNNTGIHSSFYIGLTMHDGFNKCKYQIKNDTRLKDILKVEGSTYRIENIDGNSFLYDAGDNSYNCGKRQIKNCNDLVVNFMNISNDKAIYCTVAGLREIEQNNKVYFLSYTNEGDLEIKEYNYKALKQKSSEDLQQLMEQDHIILDNVYSSRELAEQRILDETNVYYLYRDIYTDQLQIGLTNKEYIEYKEDNEVDFINDDKINSLILVKDIGNNKFELMASTDLKKVTDAKKSFEDQVDNDYLYINDLTDLTIVNSNNKEEVEGIVFVASDISNRCKLLDISNDKAIYCTVAELKEIEQNDKVYFLSYTNEGKLEVKEYNYAELKDKSSEDLQQLMEQDRIILDNVYSSKEAAEASKETIITNNRSEEENSDKPRDYNQYFKLDGNDIKLDNFKDDYVGGIGFAQNGYLANDTVFEKGIVYIEDSIFSVYGLTDYEIKQIKQEKIETLDTQFVNFMNISNDQAIYCTVAELREIEQNDKVYFLSHSDNEDLEVKEYNYKELKEKSSKDLQNWVKQDHIILDNVYSSREAAEVSKEKQKTDIILNLLKLKTQYEHKLTKYNKKLDDYIKKENIDIKVNTATDIEDEIFNKYFNKVRYYSSKLNELDEKLDPILYVDNKTKDEKQEKFFNTDKKLKEKSEGELYYFKLIGEDGKYYYQVMQYDKNTEDFDKSRELVIHVRIDVRNQYKTLFTEKETKIYSKQLDKYCTQKDDKFVICKDDGEIKNLRRYINLGLLEYFKPKELGKHPDSVNFEQDTDNVVNEESNEQLLNKSEQDKRKTKLQDMFHGVKSCEKGDCCVYSTIKKNSQLLK